MNYLLLKNVRVEDANAISGLTYGFPCITAFMGWAHALSRKLPTELDITLDGVLVASHKNYVFATKPNGKFGDYHFEQKRPSLDQKGKSPSSNEEGRLTMVVSLIVEVNNFDISKEEELLANIKQMAPYMRLAGGKIITIEDYAIIKEGEDQWALRTIMPSFVLMDRHDYLAKHYSNRLELDKEVSLIECWLDFSVLKQSSIEINNNDDTENKALWSYVPKPFPGYLVPISVGYCGISDIKKASTVKNVRDLTTDVLFAESTHSVGEWYSPHRLNSIKEAIWHYSSNDDASLYICSQSKI